MNQGIKQTFAGYLSGWGQVFLMQPFQMVKVRIQSQCAVNPEYKDIIDCVKKIYRTEGLLSFYKGTLAPLLGFGLQTSSMFYAYSSSKRFFQKLLGQDDINKPLSMYVITASAISSGPLAAVVGCPIEHSRIRIQIQKQQIGKKYSGPLDAFYKIIKQYGVKGIYRGYSAHLLRASYGGIYYFGVYQTILRTVVPNYTRSSDAPIWAQSLGGSISGPMSYLAVYPFDYAKTLLQSDDLNPKNQKFKNLVDAFKHIFLEKGGFRGLYKGVSLSCCKSFVCNSLSFPLFQGALNLMGREKPNQN